MEFKEIMATRRSIRKFSDHKVEREILQELVETTLLAPSSRNSRSSQFMIVTNALAIEQIASMRDFGSSFVKNAPAVILVMGDKSKTDLATVNSSISTTTLLFAAKDLGLEACWVQVAGRPMFKDEPQGCMAEDYLREFLPIPQECEVLCCVALGYSDFKPAALPEFDKASHITWVE